MFDIFLAAFVVMIASLSGVIFIWGTAGVWVEHNIRYLVTFSAGIFVVVVLNLLQEVFELSDNLFLIGGGFVLGIIVLGLSTYIIPKAHHHHGPGDEHAHTPIDARRMLLGDSIHNIGDGLLLVPAFLVGGGVGVGVVLAIFIHEMVQEISEFFVLKEAGYSTKKALFLNFLTASTIFLGVILGLFLEHIATVTILLIAFSAGGFCYVVVRDLLPSTMRSIQEKKHTAARHVLAGALGVVLMVSIGIFAPHIHVDEHDNTDRDHTHAEEHDH